MSLRHAAFTATRWTSAATFLRASLQIAQAMILARLLMPRDFGLMAMAAPVTVVAGLLSDLGLAGALAHFPRPDHRTWSTIYWLNLLASCGLALLVILASWPIAVAYAQIELLPVLCLLGLVFPLSALGLPFRAMAEKDLQFSKVAQQEACAAITGFLVAILVAILGGGVYAFVCGILSTVMANSALAWVRLSSGLRPALQFRLDLARPFLAFGLHRVGASFWNTLSTQADVLIAALHSSPAATALYAVPREQCLRLANTLINPVVTRVSLPVMARLQNDRTSLRAVYLQTLLMTASLNFPFYGMLALFPEQIIALLLGDQWQGAGFYLRIFALWGLLRSTGNPSGSLLNAVGMVRRAHAWNMLQLVITIPVLWISARYGGLPFLATAMCALQLISFALAWRFLVMPACGARFTDYAMQFVPPLSATMVSCGLAWALVQQAPVQWQLPLAAPFAAITYLAVSWFVNRRWLHAMLELIRPLRAWAKPAGGRKEHKWRQS